ncbi:tRNA(His) guanylyltransferase-like protein [Hapsidospora chrysogenum ATCC 11550]|uniref:tRNA(His) guanylyltransferase n=1 Tax=Hapsidospora chrysogenum (strain ATCC 11550 / CBS 779.69 / DSM 880 / IAM 14645 / JCM 23072 / IMI 49137) TaxID=857340 RepID=A0A086T7Z9_HAPC1|nr:tRNA(His) guanylyltransferase-like protein [Hapsidospora chrysogenum ATCC 11550]
MCAKYGFEKPNDRRALDLMNTAAKAVVSELPDITLAYGVSDEYSLPVSSRDGRGQRLISCPRWTWPDSILSKLVTTVVSTFTANYVYSWPTCFPGTPLSTPLPTFDGRAVCYPTVQNLRDYLSWRQADCHINNLYNTAFWALVQQGDLDNTEASKTLDGTVASEKNEILFSKFGINYNREPEMYKKGSVIFRDVSPEESTSPTSSGRANKLWQYELADPKSHDVAKTVDDLAEPVQQSKTQTEKDRKRRAKAKILVDHLDIIKDEFWDRRPWILSNKPGRIPKET